MTEYDVPDVGLFVEFYPFVAPQRRVQLVGADIHGEYLRRAVKQRILREPAGAAAYIQHRLAGKIQPERLGRTLELQRCPANVLLAGIQPDIISF